MPKDLGTTMFSGHMHTNRTLPVNNKLCNQRWGDRCQQLHKMRLDQIKPAIDNKPPTRYKHLFQNLKKAQLEDGGPQPPPAAAAPRCRAAQPLRIAPRPTCNCERTCSPVCCR